MCVCVCIDLIFDRFEGLAFDSLCSVPYSHYTSKKKKKSTGEKVAGFLTRCDLFRDPCKRTPSYSCGFKGYLYRSNFLRMNLVTELVLATKHPPQVRLFLAMRPEESRWGNQVVMGWAEKERKWFRIVSLCLFCVQFRLMALSLQLRWTNEWFTTKFYSA